MIWCDKKSSEAQDHQGTRKRKSSEDGAPAPTASKSGEHEEELLRIVDQLMDKHANKYSIPQYVTQFEKRDHFTQNFKMELLVPRYSPLP